MTEWGTTTRTQYSYRVTPDPNVLCVIPARGGSKGFPGKNIAILAGKPLLAHTIEQAMATHHFMKVVVSTDDDAIAKVAEDYGARVVKRPADISGDYVQSEKAIEHVLANTEPRPDIIVMLQCTSPIRKTVDIDKAIAMITGLGYDSVLSGVRLHQFVWRDSGNGAYPINYNPIGYRPMRQSVEEWVENGSIYAFRTEILEQTGTRLGGKMGMVTMSAWSRFEIDQVDDLDLCEWILAREP